MRAWLKLSVKIFDWLSWFPCMWTARDHHRPLSWCKHVVIWPLTWLVELWKVPRKTPLLAYINQELTTIKQNCLDRTPVASDCLLLTEGLGWRTAGSLFLGTPQLFSLPLFFCGAPPAETTSSYQSTIVYWVATIYHPSTQNIFWMATVSRYWGYGSE